MLPWFRQASVRLLVLTNNNHSKHVLCPYHLPAMHRSSTNKLRCIVKTLVCWSVLEDLSWNNCLPQPSLTSSHDGGALADGWPAFLSSMKLLVSHSSHFSAYFWDQLVPGQTSPWLMYLCAKCTRGNQWRGLVLTSSSGHCCQLYFLIKPYWLNTINVLFCYLSIWFFSLLLLIWFQSQQGKRRYYLLAPSDSSTSHLKFI